MNRAFIFTVDAALALIPVFIIISAVSMLGAGEIISIQAQTLDLNYRAEDVLAVLEKQGTLDDLAKMFANYSMLRAEGDASWRTEYERLVNLTNNTLLYLIPERYGFAIEFWGRNPDGTEYIETVFTTDNRNITGQARPYENESTTIGVASKLITGYEKEVPTQGCVARAKLTKSSKTTTKVISFLPQGSGWCGDNVEIVKVFNLPADANITNATFYVSIHYSDLISLTVNGIDMRNRINWLYKKCDFGLSLFCMWWGKTCGAFGTADITDLLNPGNNTVKIIMRNTAYHAHIHPGMRIEVTYETAQSTSPDMTKRFYFDKTVGRNGVWQVLDFYIPEGAKVSSVALYLHAEGIDVNYTIEVNGNVVDAANSPPNGGIYDKTLDISSYVKYGTNVIGVFFDTDGERESGGSGTAEISNSSYVEIRYSYLPRTTYGYLDLSRVIQFGGSPGNPKQVSFFIPSAHNRIYESFAHMAQIFSYNITIGAWAEGDLPTTVFQSPSPRAVPSRVFIDPQIFKSNKTNYVKAEDYGGNYFLPESIVEYTFLIPSQVPYGKTFKTCKGHRHTVYYDSDNDGVADGSVVVNPDLEPGFDPANDGLDDALQRLLNELNFYVNESTNSGLSGSQTNPIDIELVDVTIQREGIGGLKYLWGPIKVRLRVWG